MATSKYQRVLLKLSGEAFKGEKPFGIDAFVLAKIAQQIRHVVETRVQLAIVVGGGNFLRGANAAESGLKRVTADYGGMLATLINALALQDALEKEGVATRTQSALAVPQVAEPYTISQAVHHLDRGRVVIFAGGTGSPYLTTDTASALRAIEVGAQVLLMAKHNVDGIYSADPHKDPTAKKFDKLTHRQALEMRLGVMDITAFSLCLEHKLPIIVFDLKADRSLEHAVAGEPIGTIVVSE